MLMHNPRATRQRYSPHLESVMNMARARESRRLLAAWPGITAGATPLYRLSGLAAALGVSRIDLKDESRRSPLMSFKALGAPLALARHVMAHLGIEDDPSGLFSGDHAAALDTVTVISATDGNHGLGLAAAARDIGCGCVIVLHAHVSAERVEAIAAYGARIIRVAGNYDAAVEEAARLAAAEGWQVVSDTSWPGYETIPRDVMQGYGIIADEVIPPGSRRCPYTHVLVQGGVGGLAAGVLGYLCERFGAARPRMIIVEPTQADCLYQSALQGEPACASGSVDSVMAGLACGAASPLAWRFLADSVDDFLLIDDGQAVSAMRRLAAGEAGDIPVVSGESGAAGVAGLDALGAHPPWRAAVGLDEHSRVLVINTEGATAPALYESLAGEPAESVLARQANWLAR